MKVSVSPATVSRVLRRLVINRLSALEPAEPARRYEREHSGEDGHLHIGQMHTLSAPAHSIELIPVDIVAEKPAPPLTPAQPEHRGAIEITLVSGVRIRVDGGVSVTTLKRTLSALKATT